MVAVAIAAGAPAQLADAWDEFKDPAAQTAILGKNDPSRLGSLSSTGRYELWSVALDSLEASPGTGTGPGTYEFTWLRDTSIGGTVRDAHSFYLELGAEAGWPGIALGVAFVLALLTGVFQLRRRDSGERWLAAAGLAAVVAFAFSAGVDWMWELPVIPLATLLLVAAIFVNRGSAAHTSSPSRLHRIGFALAALVPIGLLAVVLAGASSVEQSRADVRAGALSTALERAVDAHAIDPDAATPLLQSALVREQAGNLAGATADARAAAEREPDNWRTWFVLSRLEARIGNAQASVEAFRRAPVAEPSSRCPPTMTLRPDDLESHSSQRERDSLARVAQTLTNERPLPSANFRGELRRRLLADPGSGVLRSRWSVLTVRRGAVASLTTGTLLLAYAALGLAGVGTLAPSEAAEAVARFISIT